MASSPLYSQIKCYLLERIQSGTFPADHQIPPEEQLAEDFDVSRMTANKAIRELVNDGYLVRYAGLGTFVTHRKAESSLLEIHNIADEVRGRDHVYRNDVVRRETTSADDDVALRLGVRLGTSVFHTTIIHRENDVPIQLEDRYVNPHWVPHYLQTDFAHHTPNEVLVAACPISDMEHIVEALNVDAQAAEWLELEPSEACLRLAHRTWSADHLISYAHLIYPGGRYKLRAIMAKNARSRRHST
ncbi:histidine utilization repressor [Salinisphaera sp. USBA-960]|nr:histidine utilization repressor [Salifodinibacter halophilus]NNC25736.1 histidine utilization repressor [Salifodinibacter halophilus]